MMIATTMGLKPGMKVTMTGQRNSVRHWVDRVESATTASIRTYIRPSRGFARHMRRLKAARR